VEFTLAEVPDALLVPPVAVVPGLTEKNVFVAQGGQAVRRAVEIGVRTATTVQILAGLQPDDVVITSGIQSLRPGLPVEVMP
jgi:membrane fusion protein (multidrug efflux system)